MYSFSGDVKIRAGILEACKGLGSEGSTSEILLWKTGGRGGGRWWWWDEGNTERKLAKVHGAIIEEKAIYLVGSYYIHLVEMPRRK